MQQLQSEFKEGSTAGEEANNEALEDTGDEGGVEGKALSPIHSFLSWSQALTSSPYFQHAHDYDGGDAHDHDCALCVLCIHGMMLVFMRFVRNFSVWPWWGCA